MTAAPSAEPASRNVIAMHIVVAALAGFVVVPRPGDVEAPFPAPFRGRTLHGFPFGVSSSQIRARVKAGLPIHGLAPDAVAEVIRNEKLYQ